MSLPGYYSCYRDIDHDGVADIVLVYSWDTHKMELHDAMLVEEYETLTDAY